jgi:hypothetical protein
MYYAQCCYAECRYVECRYAECHAPLPLHALPAGWVACSIFQNALAFLLGPKVVRLNIFETHSCGICYKVFSAASYIIFIIS